MAVLPCGASATPVLAQYAAIAATLCCSAVSRTVSSGYVKPAACRGSLAAARLAALTRPAPRRALSEPKPFSAGSIGRSLSAWRRSAR